MDMPECGAAVRLRHQFNDLKAVMFRWVASLFQSGPKDSRTGSQSSPEPIELGIISFRGAVADVEGLPQPRWELIAFELEKRFADADPELIWNSAALEWLHLLRQ